MKDDMNEQQKIERIYLSLFEKKFEKLCIKLVPYVPRRFSPNGITIIGFAGSVAAGVSFYLAGYWRFWFLIAVLGLLTHLTLDNIDGAVARDRGQASQKGQLLDIFTDSVGIAAIFLGVGFSSYASLKIMILPLVIWYLHLIVEYNWIMLKNKWIFPFISNFEIHLTLSALALASFIFGTVRFGILGHMLGLFDIVAAISVVLSFIELLYHAIKLYRQV